jgi:hypothetical protein
MSQEIRIDALLPQEMATRAEYIGVRKAEAPALTLITLSVMAGAFIALGAVFSTTIWAGTVNDWPYGVSRLLGGLVFCLYDWEKARIYFVAYAVSLVLHRCSYRGA